MICVLTDYQDIENRVRHLYFVRFYSLLLWHLSYWIRYRIKQIFSIPEGYPRYGSHRWTLFSMSIFHIPSKRSHHEYHIFIEIWLENKKNIKTSLARVLIAVKIRYDANSLLNSDQWQLFLIHTWSAKGITSFYNEWKLYFMFSFE